MLKSCMNFNNFYLGTHLIHWLEFVNIPLFISERQLRKKKKLRSAVAKWCLDSGGFSELSMFGKWTITPKDYVSNIKRYNEYVGKLEWCAIQDYMCEPFIINKTGLSVKEHQQRTVNSYLELKNLAPDVNFIPILQGYAITDYLEHIELYSKHNIDLTAFQTVGIGSVCRRQKTKEITNVLETISKHGISLHGFGIKKQGLEKSSDFLFSADSMAWSFDGRYSWIKGHNHYNCANCLEFALLWYDDIKQIFNNKLAISSAKC